MVGWTRSAQAAVTFGPPTAFPAGSSPTGIVLADVNGDHRLDAVVCQAVRRRLRDGHVGRRKALSPGRYLAVLVATDSGGRRNVAHAITFTPLAG